jgi:hypothetical protein
MKRAFIPVVAGAGAVGLLTVVQPPAHQQPSRSVAAAVGLLAVAQPATHEQSFTSVVAASLSNLVLYAFGTHQVAPENMRLPVATADATYEVIVKRPGPPTLEQLAAVTTATAR